VSIHAVRGIYEGLPGPVRAVCGAAGRLLPVRLRYGSAFVSEREVLREASASHEEASRVAAQRFSAVIDAAMRTPFWAEVLGDAVGEDAAGLTLADLGRVPLLEKETVRASLEAMLDPACPPARRKYVTTGGTAGRPLGLWIDKDASVRDWAHVVAAWSQLGYTLDDKRLVLRGVRLGRGDRRRLWHYEPLRRELYVSVFDLDPEHLPEIRLRIAQLAPRFVHGYPSAMEILGKSYLSDGPPASVRGVFPVSENLYPGQQEYLATLWQAPVLSFYGMSEKAAFASQCTEGDGYHVHETYGHVELVDATGKRIEEPGVRGEIVATGLVSTCVPLIRYRTGDFASWVDGACPCGRPGRKLSRIEGRWAREYLVTRSGSHVHMSAVNVHSDVFDRVARFRFVQTMPGTVKLLVVPSAGFTAEDTEAIHAEMAAKLEGLVDVEIRVVQTLEPTERGKGVFIEQLIAGEGADSR